MRPGIDTHPRGYANPVILRVSAILPPAGAWDATPLESFSTYADFLTLNFTYTPDAQGVNGAFDFQMWTSLYFVAARVPTGADEWVAPPIYASGAVVAGADTQSLLQEEYQTYTPDTNATHSFEIGPIPLRATIARIRVRARESGDTDNPGVLQITGVLA